MEEEQTNLYELKFTISSRQHFQELLDYLFDQYGSAKSEGFANSLIEKTISLSQNPLRGRIEESLKTELLEYRFILFPRTQRADIKILYRVDQETKTVYIIDFFPTEMDSHKLQERVK